MKYKILEDWISYIAGVFGFGVFWTNVHWNEILPKIILGAVSAFVAGYIGYIGKQVAVWSIHKVKIFFTNIKNRRK